MAKIIPNKPLLILLYGFPGAGKTFFARQFCESLQAAHIQGDRIRYELFDNPRYDKQENDLITQLMNYMSEEFLSAGISVVYDVNAMRGAQRMALRDMARRSRAQSVLIWLQVDAETSYGRSAKRDRRKADDKFAAAPDRNTFKDIIGHMQNPQMSEDYVVISGKHTFNTQFSAVAKKLRELKLVGIDDATSRVVKPGMVNLIPNPSAGRVDMTRRNIIIR